MQHIRMAGFCFVCVMKLHRTVRLWVYILGQGGEDKRVTPKIVQFSVPGSRKPPYRYASAPRARARVCWKGICFVPLGRYYVYIYIYIYIHTYMYVVISLSLSLSLSPCIYIYMYICVCVYIYIYIYI